MRDQSDMCFITFVTNMESNVHQRLWFQSNKYWFFGINWTFECVLTFTNRPHNAWNRPLGGEIAHVEGHWFRGSACFAYDKTVINQRSVEKSAFEDQSEENSVWIIKWTTLLGIFCKISFTPTVTSCYQVHADAHLSAALLCYLGATAVADAG